MSITLKDVAEAAGVSVTAVSKVLHGRGRSVRVGEDRAALIREVAERLNYRPNGLAQNLRLGRAQTVGLIFENWGSIANGPLYYVHLLDGVAQEVFRQHYRLTIVPEVDGEHLQTALGDGRLDGAIWCKLPDDPIARAEVMKSTIPFVALNSPPPVDPGGTVYVACDNHAGTRLVVDHLLALGHERILFVKEASESSTPDALAREAGLRDALTERGLACGPDDVVVWNTDAHEFDAWVGTTDHTAVFAWNEHIAGRILERARALGVEIPSELSVVGFDSTPYCDTTLPRLTAVRQPIREMACFAAETLLAMIRGDLPDRLVHLFPCRLDVRDSTAAPSRTRPPRPQLLEQGRSA